MCLYDCSVIATRVYPTVLARSLEGLQEGHLSSNMKGFSELAWSWLPIPLGWNLHGYHWTCSSTAIIHISTLAWLLPSNASQHCLHCTLQVHLQFGSITASKCILKQAQSKLPSVSLSSLTSHLKLFLWLHWGTICTKIGWMYIYRYNGISNTCLLVI